MGPHRHCLDLSLSLLLLRLLSSLCIDRRSLWHWRWPEERPSLSSAASPSVLCPSLSSAHLCPEATSPSWSSSEPRRKEAVSGKVGLNCPRIAELLFAGISLSSSTHSDVFVHHLWTRRPFQDWCCAEVDTSVLLSTDNWHMNGCQIHFPGAANRFLRVEKITTNAIKTIANTRTSNPITRVSNWCAEV